MVTDGKGTLGCKISAPGKHKDVLKVREMGVCLVSFRDIVGGDTAVCGHKGATRRRSWAFLFRIASPLVTAYGFGRFAIVWKHSRLRPFAWDPVRLDCSVGAALFFVGGHREMECIPRLCSRSLPPHKIRSLVTAVETRTG